MTYEEFCKEAGKVFLDSKGTYRLGQAYYNTLHDYRPELASQLVGTIYDPFYMSEYELPKFFAWLKENW